MFFENPDNKIFADLTGNLMVPRAPTKAHRIPASIISLNSAGNLQVKWVDEGDVVRASVDQKRRVDIMRNHSATHLLHTSLRNLLGDHVLQKGSLVADDRLRFDFSHGEPLTKQQIHRP